MINAKRVIQAVLYSLIICQLLAYLHVRHTTILMLRIYVKLVTPLAPVEAGQMQMIETAASSMPYFLRASVVVKLITLMAMLGTV